MKIRARIIESFTIFYLISIWKRLIFPNYRYGKHRRANIEEVHMTVLTMVKITCKLWFYFICPILWSKVILWCVMWHFCYALVVFVNSNFKIISVYFFTVRYIDKNRRYRKIYTKLLIKMIPLMFSTENYSCFYSAAFNMIFHQLC